MVRDSRKIAAILAADVVDYSRLMGADEAGTLAALKARRAIFDEQVREFDGREFGSVGDSLMARFGSAVNAVSCALAIQELVEAANAPLPPAQRMHLRIGVNLGDVIEEHGSAFGDAVNIAARLQALAKPGHVLISGPVYDQVHLRLPARFIAAGTRQVKNIREPVRTYEVLPPEQPGLRGRAATAAARLLSRRVVRAAIVIVTLSASAALGLYWREIPVPGTDRTLGALLLKADPERPANAIAVLPFVNLSGDPANDYLGEGLAEELAHRLAKIPGLRVASRTSAFAFKGKDAGLDEISGRLGVGYIVEGSVRRQADRVRVNASLVDSVTGTSRWSNSYEESSGDMFAVESDIGTQVIAALELVLGTHAAEGAPAPSGGSGVAYDYYLQGLSYLRQSKTARTLAAAEELFGRALSAQPDFARAQAGLCETRVEQYALERLPALVHSAEEACRRAKALDSTAQEVHMAAGTLRLATGDAAVAEAEYRQALAIAPQSADVLLGLATALAAGDRNEEAERAFRQAIAAHPRYAAAELQYGNFLLVQGRAGDAVPHYVRATILEPDNPNAFSNLGAAYIHLGDFDQAAEALTRSLAIEPRRGSYSNLGIVQYYRGRFREAAEMFAEATELAPADHRPWGNLADALRFDRRENESQAAYRKAFELVDGELKVNPKHAANQAQAAYYATRLGDGDRARRCIAIALAEGDDNNDVHYYVGLAELGLGDKVKAAAHIRRARQLGYPDNILKAAPELGEIRTMI